MPSRSIAVAATGALAVFGSVASQGAQGDLQAGLDRSTHDVNAVADVWVAPGRHAEHARHRPVRGRMPTELPTLAGVRAVGTTAARSSTSTTDAYGCLRSLPARRSRSRRRRSWRATSTQATQRLRAAAGRWSRTGSRPSATWTSGIALHPAGAATAHLPRRGAEHERRLATRVRSSSARATTSAAGALAAPRAFQVTLRGRHLARAGACRESNGRSGPTRRLTVETDAEREARHRATSRAGARRASTNCRCWC